jgi:PhnB protein
MKDFLQQTQIATFVPTLYMSNLSSAIEFYKEAFGAIERWRISNPDGGVHVAEMSLPPVLFRMHEEVSRDSNLSPSTMNAITIVLGLLVADPDALAERAMSAGAKEISPMKNYEYGYRQGTIVDPFGHHWCIEGLDGLTKTPSIG